MEKLIFTSSNGDVIRFDGPPFHLMSVQGLGDVGATIQLQKSPFQDGSTRIDSILEERVVPIEFLIVCDSYKEVSEARIKMAKTLNPKLGEGTLRYENDFVVREIKAFSESVPMFPDGTNRTETIQKGLISLLCPSPFWQDIETIESEMNVFIGKLEFPLEFSGAGIEFGVQGEETILTNSGDVSAPVRIEFNGPAVNPKVTNLNTGEYILVNRTVGEEQKLVLATDFGEKRVEIHNADGTIENAFAWIDLNSTFFQLEPGENRIKYEADVGMDTARVYITYKNRYVSV